MSIKITGQLSIKNDISSYLYSTIPTSDISINDCYTKTKSWGTSISTDQIMISSFYGFEYTISVNPDPITHDANNGNTTVQITTQNGNASWHEHSPYTSDSYGLSLGYDWLTVTNVNTTNATFSATFTDNTGNNSNRTGYITIKNLKEDDLIITVTQNAGDPH